MLERDNVSQLAIIDLFLLDIMHVPFNNRVTIDVPCDPMVVEMDVLLSCDELWTCCPWSYRLRPKKIFKSVPPADSGFLAIDHLPRVSHQSRLAANDKGDNEMITRAVHRSGIYLTVEETPLKTSVRIKSKKAVRSVIAKNGTPYLQTRSVGSHSARRMETEGKKERTESGWDDPEQCTCCRWRHWLGKRKPLGRCHQLLSWFLA